MKTKSGENDDFRIAIASKLAPRAVADSGRGTIVAVADVDAPPDRVFRALTTNEVERWWGHADYYRQEDWKADLRVCGPWSVNVRFPDGSTNTGSGEFAEIDPPHKLVMTRRFEKHPLQDPRETTITYRLEPIATGTRLTVRDEGLIGRSEAAYGNAEHWERVLAWLDGHFQTHAADSGRVDDKQHDGYQSNLVAKITPEAVGDRISPGS
jgi:uncharacterized protein YndB with AHSA1/START domain